jgi:hypothetical protein
MMRSAKGRRKKSLVSLYWEQHVPLYLYLNNPPEYLSLSFALWLNSYSGADPRLWKSSISTQVETIMILVKTTLGRVTTAWCITDTKSITLSWIACNMSLLIDRYAVLTAIRCCICSMYDKDTYSC